ncbi:MAG: hypothetical protein HQK75_11735 [Candidatus Magnetomorum sp.]|nr:hypothetical protein [Candidatus Magnetomorum sp.]
MKNDILKKLLIVSFLWIIPCSGICSTPDIIFSTSENIIDLSNNSSQYNTLALSSGGAVFENNPDVMVVSFGQPFAGKAFYHGSDSELCQMAAELYEDATGFLNSDDVLKKGLDQEGNMISDMNYLSIDPNGNPLFSEQKLKQALDLYNTALFINPFNLDAIRGSLKSIQAQCLKNNLVWDIKRRHQLRLRLTDSGMDTGQAVLEKEIEIFEDISAMQKESLVILFHYFPRALQLKKYSIDDADLVDKSINIIISTGRRFADAQMELAHKRLLRNFFNEDSVQNENSRSYATMELGHATEYMTNLINILNSINDFDFQQSTQALQLAVVQSKMNELYHNIGQGYNTFGFLPDFVPFVKGGVDNNNLSTFNTMYAISEDAVSTAKEKENTAKSVENKFAQSNADYQEKMTEIHTSYSQRLKSIIGSVIMADGVETPDFFTYKVPDIDVNGDGITCRDEVRNLMRDEYGYNFQSKGQIALQYANMKIAETRVDSAFEEIKSLVSEIEIREETARKVLGIQGNIAQIILADGKQMGLLTRQKGDLHKLAAENIAKAQRYSNLFGALFQGILSAFENIKKIFSDIKNMFGSFGNAWDFVKNPVNNIKDKIKDKVKDGKNWVKKKFGFRKRSLTAALAIGSIGASVVNGIMGSEAAAKISLIQGELSKGISNIDASIIEIQALERAKIVMAQGRQELLKTEQEVQILVLKQARMKLNIYMAMRDVDREMQTIINLLNQAETLIVDLSRVSELNKKNFDNLAIGWAEDDVRDVLTNSTLIADKAFYRAQVWSFIALRGLEYYANLKPDTNGQPNPMIRSLYNQLYTARRSDDLDKLLSNMRSKAESDFLFTRPGIECPERGLLSLKYDVFVPSLVNYGSDTIEIDNESDYRYLDRKTGILYQGGTAYQALFRNVLRRGLSGTNSKRTLKISFSTDLFPRYASGNVIGDNPFFSASGTSAKIIGFTNQNCSGPGIFSNVQGIQVNMTGKLDIINGPRIELAQMGNAYLKHSSWKSDDFDDNANLIQPLQAINVFSAYRQVLPTWMIGDLIETDIQEEIIGSNVHAVIRALRNGQGPAGKSLEFTDRSVANDYWVLTINEIEDGANTQFFNQLDAMLESPLSEDTIQNEFLTDIQLWIGWAYRNPDPYKKRMKEEL